MAKKFTTPDSSPTSSSRSPYFEKQNEADDGDLDATSAELRRINFQDNDGDDFAEQRDDQRLADAELESQRSEKRRNEAPQAAAPYDRRELLKQANNELRETSWDSPQRSPAKSAAAKSSQPTTPRGGTTGASSLPSASDRGDRGDARTNSPHADATRKVGFNERADYIEDEDSSRQNGGEVQLVVARGNKFSMHREGDMLAEDDSGRDEQPEMDGEDAQRAQTAPGRSADSNTAQRSKSATVSRAPRTELNRRRVATAQLRSRGPPPDSIDPEDGRQAGRRDTQSRSSNRARSAYAVSEEQKREREKWLEREKERKRAQEERDKEERQKKEEENKQVFESWLAEKQRQREEESERKREREELERKREERRQREAQRQKEEEKQKRKKERQEKEQARRERDEAERRRFEESDAYKSWWETKRKQLERERKIEEERRKELNELFGIRSESEERSHLKDCERAFRKWKRQKAEQEEREREKLEQRARITRLVLKHISRSQQISSAMQSRYTDYYGSRF